MGKCVEVTILYHWPERVSLVSVPLSRGKKKTKNLSGQIREDCFWQSMIFWQMINN